MQRVPLSLGYINNRILFRKKLFLDFFNGKLLFMYVFHLSTKVLKIIQLLFQHLFPVFYIPGMTTKYRLKIIREQFTDGVHNQRDRFTIHNDLSLRSDK